MSAPDRPPHLQPTDGGRVVPAYALTQGRTRSRGVDLPLEALAVITAAGREHHLGLTRERRAILDLCARPTSVAEVAAHLALPIGVARVLVGDLAATGYLAVHQLTETTGSPSRAILERLLVGLRAR